MGLHAPTKANVVFNLEHLVDVEVFLGLSCVLLLLEIMHNFISSIRCGTSLCMISLLHSK
jgi:hypothetical protein